jgi:YggT family protein
MGYILGRVLQTVIELYVVVIFIDALLSFFLPPYHRVREFFDKLVNPLLNPIRRVVPPLGMVDISPLILLLLVQLVGSMVVNVLFQIP